MVSTYTTLNCFQIETFRNIKDTFGHALLDNYRPTQPVGRRKIYENRVFLQDLPEESSEKKTSKEEAGEQEIRSSDGSKEKEKGNGILENTKYTTHDHVEPDTQPRGGNKTGTGNDHKSSSNRVRIGSGFLLTTVAFIIISLIWN